MNYEAVTNAILKYMGKKPSDHGAYTDLLSACRQWEQENFQAAHAVNGQLKATAAKMLRESSPKEAAFFYEMWRKSLLFDAPHFFDSFLLYIELDRKPEDRFYAPRRHYLKPMVQGYQDVLDGKLRLLTISEPKRAGKSQTGINFVNMISGKYPDRSTLMEGTGDDLVKSFYNGCLEYLVTPNEYLFYDVFPEAKLVQTHADTKVINLKSKSRFPTIMCRSIDARQVGLSEATNVLYLDDCVEGREEAKNRQRLDDKWEIISGDIMGRAIEGTPNIEPYAPKAGHVEVRLRDNINPIVETDEMTGQEISMFEYDEYTFVLPDREGLREDIEANMADWLVTGRTLEVNEGASILMDMKDALGIVGVKV